MAGEARLSVAEIFPGLYLAYSRPLSLSNSRCNYAYLITNHLLLKKGTRKCRVIGRASILLDAHAFTSQPLFLPTHSHTRANRYLSLVLPRYSFIHTTFLTSLLPTISLSLSLSLTFTHFSNYTRFLSSYVCIIAHSHILPFQSHTLINIHEHGRAPRSLSACILAHDVFVG